MENRKPKVLFTYVEAGFGHIIPMRGMANAFRAKYGDKCEIVEADLFKQSKNPAVNKMGDELTGYSKTITNSWLLKQFETLSYHVCSPLTLKVLDAHFYKGRKAFESDFAEINPDLTVASYYMPNHLAYQCNKKGLTDTLIATYTPDPYIYPAWDRNCDLYMVNNDEAYRQAVKKGFKKEKVLKIPCVYRKCITEMNLTKEEARKSVGIEDRFTVLTSSGAYGTKQTRVLLEKLLTANLKINVVALCGVSEELKKMAEELKAVKSSETNFYAIGFTDKVAEYMRASDVMIGKSGSNTVMEAAYLSCPMIINAEINSLEAHTAKFCEEEGIAVRIKNPNKIVSLIKKAISDPSIISSINPGAEKYNQPNGDEVAADALFELLKTKSPNL